MSSNKFEAIVLKCLPGWLQKESDHVPHDRQPITALYERRSSLLYSYTAYYVNKWHVSNAKILKWILRLLNSINWSSCRLWARFVTIASALQSGSCLKRCSALRVSRLRFSSAHRNATDNWATVIGLHCALWAWLVLLFKVCLHVSIESLHWIKRIFSADIHLRHSCKL